MNVQRPPAVHSPRVLPGSNRGFTLIELMVVVLIVAILGSIAYNAYSNNVLNSRRSAASACLVEQAQFMERYYTTRLTYRDANPVLACETDLAGFYTFSTPTAATATDTIYSLTATPVVGSPQAKDTKCGALGLNQAGAKSKTGSGTVADCW